EQMRLAQSQKPQQPRTRVKRAEPDVTRNPDAGQATAPASASGEGGDAAPAKKRRRRRKPANREGGAMSASLPPDAPGDY
ncbi:MAG: polynucleotide adenylyltransferase PcnB, partial [Polaromonas sp.]|nr:polynucleotide adenylyltransferase PcnB [Polaromonas sp.]